MESTDKPKEKKDVITSEEVQIISTSNGYVLVTDFRFEFASGKEESFSAISDRLDAEVNAFRNKALRGIAKSFNIFLKFEN